MTTSTATTAATFHQSPAVQNAIETIVRELTEAQATITEARPPQAELAATLADWLARLANAKGKGALFPYVGSGLGHGALVELEDGSVKWDLINGIGVHMFGHSDADLVATAVRAAMQDTVMQGNLQFNADSIAFAELLINEASRDSEIRHAFLTNSGAMANENALKICMHAREGRAARVLAFDDCFMGRTTTLAQIGDSAGGRVDVPLNAQVDYMPFFDPSDPEGSTAYAVRRLDQYLARYPGQHACFVMELVQGEGGFNIAPREFLVALMERCKTHGVYVWADEIQTFGRCESMFYFNQLDLGQYIDIVTIGKMSQVCACLYTEALNPRPGLLSGTFIGSTVGLNVGRRSLQRLLDGGYYGPDGRIAGLHAAFRAAANDLIDRHPEWFPPLDGAGGDACELAGGVGGMMRLTPFGGDKAKIIKLVHTMFERGVIGFYCGHGPYHVRFLPPVGVLEPDRFAEIFAIVEAALADVAGAE